MSANFSDLQSVDTVNDADQMMLRLNNGATGPDGFARIALSALNSAFTSNLTASDSKVKELSAQWIGAYSQVSANSAVFTLTVANSSSWDTAYSALSTNDYNYGYKEFNYVAIKGIFDAPRANFPTLRITRNGTITDMVQVITDETVSNSMFRITTAGHVAINANAEYIFAPQSVLYVNGNQVIDGAGGNALTVNGDLFVNGSLSALSATFVTSTVTQTSALSVTNNGIGPALFVKQTGVQPAVIFNGDAATITFASDGDITGFSDLSGSGRIIAGAGNTASNAVSYMLGSNNNDNNHAGVIILGSNIIAPSANYTYVQNLSSPGIIAANALNASTVTANSVVAGGKTSSDWNSTYTTVNAQSAALLPLFSTVSTQSANNASVYSSFNAQSANNASVYSTTTTNSATWSRLSTSFNVVTAIAVNALSAIGSNADISVALVAKGTGATLAQYPDSTTVGGIPRGAYATDFQKYRTDASQVAVGQFSTIAGGYQNTAEYGAAVGGGSNNTATGLQFATIAGGVSNTASGEYSTVGGGASNNASGRYATIGGGNDNTASETRSTVAGGDNNNASGSYSTVVGGKYNLASGIFSTSLGLASHATNYGEFACSGGLFSSYGDNKSSTFLSRRTTSAAGSAVAYLDGLTNTEEITLPSNSTYAYTATIVGLSSHQNSSGLHYILRGFAKCNSSGDITVYPASSDLTQRIPVTLNAGISASGDKLRVVVYTPSAAIHYWTARIQAEYMQF